MKINWKVFITSIIIVYFIAFLGSIFTSSNTDSEWYNSIKPDITPPNWVFPLVWNVLFFLIAISLYLSWIKSKNKKSKNRVKLVFGINLVLNLLWSVIFFGMKNPPLALVNLILLWLSIIAMIFVTKDIDKKSSYLLIPYLIWISFAGVLNWIIVF